MKRCPKCEEVKPLDCFGKNQKQHDGLQPYCKLCQAAYLKVLRATPEGKAKAAEYARKAYAKNPEKHKGRERSDSERVQSLAYYRANREAQLERMSTWQKANRPVMRAHEQARRALKKGATIEYVDPNVLYDRAMGVCWLCDMPVDRGSFTVEHKIPLTRGGAHSYANTDIAHSACNTSKHNLTPEEFYASDRCVSYLRKGA